MPTPSALTLVFTKRPRPGEVKTRLCPPLSPRQASDLAQAMLDDLLERFLACADFATGIAAAPASQLEWFRARYPRAAPIVPQQGVGLAERLAAAFAAHGAGGLVVTGSDAPLLPAARVREAHAGLARGLDAVFVPDQGGGYCLVGLARPAPRLFLDVSTSTADNLERTLERARSLGLRYELLSPENDLDLPRDLRELACQAQEPTVDAARRPERTFQVLRSLLPILR